MCKMFGITLGTLWNWRKQGMPHVGKGPGLSIFYEEAEVLKWLSQRKINKKEETKKAVKALYED